MFLVCGKVSLLAVVMSGLLNFLCNELVTIKSVVRFLLYLITVWVVCVKGT